MADPREYLSDDIFSIPAVTDEYTGDVLAERTDDEKYTTNEIEGAGGLLPHIGPEQVET